MPSLGTRVILVTDVVVAALYSLTGASAAIVMAALEGRLDLLANVALVLEYEAVCLRPEHLQRAVLRTAAFFAERRKRADMAQLHSLLTRSGGAPPQPGDER